MAYCGDSKLVEMMNYQQHLLLEFPMELQMVSVFLFCVGSEVVGVSVVELGVDA